MKRNLFKPNGSGLLALLAGLLFSFQLSAQLIGWNPTGATTFGPSPWVPATLDANLSMVNTGLIRGSDIAVSGTPAGSCWGGSGGWSGTDAGSIYFTFKANAGYQVSLSSISSAIRRSNSGPSSNFVVSYSFNGGAYVQVGVWNNTVTSGTTGGANSTTLSGVAALQNIAAGVEVRFRISFPTSAGATNWYLTGAANSLRLAGTVTPVATPCLAPTGLTAANTSASTSDFSWAAQAGNTFEYAVNTTAADPATAGTATAGTTFNATGLLSNTAYYLHVRTDCGGGTFSPWTTISFTTLFPPCPVPTGLAAANTTATTADLSWDVQGANSFEYVLDQVTAAPSGAGTATTGTTFNATALTPSTVYYLHVRTDCGSGNLSPWTTITFTTPVAPCIAPTGLTAANTTATTSDLSWSAQGGNSFEYVVNTTAADPATAGTATTGTTFNATALTPSTVYYLHVRTDCGSGNLSPWTTITFTTLVAPCIAPTGLTAANTTATTSDLSWTAQGGNSFEYVVNTASTDPATAGTATAGTTFNATALTPSTVYYLHVRTDCGSGNFSPWTTITFTTLVAPCAAPTGLTAANTTATTSDLSWSAQGGNSFEYVVSTTAAAPATAGTATAGTTFNAISLQSETVYYLHVRTDCGSGNFSPWTTITFTTLVTPCAAPTGLTAANTTATTSDLLWAAQGGNSFEYVVNTTAAAPATAGTATAGTTFNATALTPSAVYYLHVRTDCGSGNLSPWTTITFTTLVAPCIAPTGLTAANTTATTSDLSWTAQGGNSFEYVVNTTAAAPATAGTATAGTTFNATSLQAETIYYLHVRTDCGSGNFSPWTTITFTTLVAPCIAPTGLTAANTTATTSDLSWTAQSGNSFEYVVNTTAAAPATAGTATTGTTFNATSLQAETVYYLHVRTDCGSGNFSPWTTITFTTLVTPCAAPTGLTAANTTATTSDLSWAAQGGNSFQYVVNTAAADPSTSGTGTPGTTVNATGLTAGTVYYLHVRTNCGSGNFSPWTTITFTTLAAACTTPSGLSALNISLTSADLLWNTQAGITGFEYVVDQSAATPAGAGTPTVNNAFGATALSQGTTYHFHVRANCGNGNFSAWTTLAFTTLSNVGLEEATAAGFTVYPNPSTGIVYLDATVQQGTVTLVNLKGQQLLTVDLASATTMDLSHLESGLYFITYTLNGRQSLVKLIKE